MHLDSTHDATHHVMTLEAVLQRQGVHNGSKHAHAVSLGTIHSRGSTREATENVATTDNDGNLSPIVINGLNLMGELLEHIGVDAVVTAPMRASPDSLSRTRLYL